MTDNQKEALRIVLDFVNRFGNVDLKVLVAAQDLEALLTD